MWGDAFPFTGRNLVCLYELIGNYSVWEKASGPFLPLLQLCVSGVGNGKALSGWLFRSKESL